MLSTFNVILSHGVRRGKIETKKPNLQNEIQLLQNNNQAAHTQLVYGGEEIHALLLISPKTS